MLHPVFAMAQVPTWLVDAGSAGMVLIAVLFTLQMVFKHSSIFRKKGSSEIVAPACPMQTEPGAEAFWKQAAQVQRLDDSHHGAGAQLGGGQLSWQVDAVRSKEAQKEAKEFHKEQMVALAKLDATMNKVVVILERNGRAG